MYKRQELLDPAAALMREQLLEQIRQQLDPGAAGRSVGAASTSEDDDCPFGDTVCQQPLFALAFVVLLLGVLLPPRRHSRQRGASAAAAAARQVPQGADQLASQQQPAGAREARRERG